jgi:hypothetical protein
MPNGPFNEMSDTELNEQIARWENYAPENFWQDGELQMSRNQAYAYYRKRWRQQTPAQQDQHMQELSSTKYGSQRIADEGLQIRAIAARWIESQREDP